ncbi:hypothetical protein ABZS71_06510 [Streptomyces sp. NPDC005393]
MSHRRKSPAERAGLVAFRAARMGLLIGAELALLVLVIALCIAGNPNR